MMTSSYHLSANIDTFTLGYPFSDHIPDDTVSLSNDDLNLLLQSDHPNLHYQNQCQSLSPFSSFHLDQHKFQHKTITPTTNPTSTPTPSASDPETFTTPKRRATLNSKQRITKRKSRATKKNQTTFITADPANFRQMVQQITGIRFDNNSSSTSSQFPPSLTNLLRPETRRPMERLYNAYLPTLDTSSFSLDHNQNQCLIGDHGVYGGLGSVGVGVQTVNVDESGYGVGGASNGFVSFPTLESWKVM